ncbi:bile acid:sodium symporter [Gemmata sp.]|uniref:bile acid:sodium symporter n=1 Tax=Gemmata sp. TaxID=1914242 RepID=UPI003F719405
MWEFLEAATAVAVPVFVVTCMAAAGLGLRVRDIAAPLGRGRLVALALVANFGAAPAAAWLLVACLPLDRAHATGLLLLGGAAGAPFLPKLAAAARGDAAFSVGLMLLLMVASVAFLPVALPAMVPGLAAEPWPLLRPLLVSMLLPLAAGVAVREWSERWAARVRPAVATLSSVSMVAAVVLLVGLNFSALLATIGTGAVGAGVVFVAVSTAAGYALGTPSPDTRSVLALGTGQRNIAAALLIATQNYPNEPGVVVMLLVTTLAGLAVLLAAARWFAGHRAPRTPAAAGTEEG